MNISDLVQLAQRAEMKIGQHEGSDDVYWEGQEYVPVAKLERFAKLLRAAAFNQAAEVAGDSEHIVDDVPGYYAQLGDAYATANKIAAAIRRLAEEQEGSSNGND